MVWSGSVGLKAVSASLCMVGALVCRAARRIRAPIYPTPTEFPWMLKSGSDDFPESGAGAGFTDHGGGKQGHSLCQGLIGDGKRGIERGTHGLAPSQIGHRLIVAAFLTQGSDPTLERSGIDAPLRAMPAGGDIGPVSPGHQFRRLELGADEVGDNRRGAG